MSNGLVYRLVRALLILSSLSISIFSAQHVSAQSIHLALCVDGSGSISGTDFNLQLQGTATAVQDVVPIDGSVELSVIVFATNISPVHLNGAAAGNSIVVNSQADKDSVEALILGVTQPNGSTNTQGCISTAMDQMGCGTATPNGNPVNTCPTDQVQIIDISTDGNPTASSYDDPTQPGVCPNAGSTNVGCQEDAVDAAEQASSAGVDAINVIGVGPGPSVGNMQEWTFDNIGLTSTVGVQDGEVFDPAGIESPPGSGMTADGYTIGNPELGDRGYVVLVADFGQYEPTINAKIFNELNVVSDISVVKTANQETITPGGTLIYTLSVTGGGEEVPDVVVTDTLPPTVTFVSAAAVPANPDVSCGHAAGIVTCDITTLGASPATVDIEVEVTVN